MFRYIGHIVRRRYFPGYRLTSNTILYFTGKPGRSRRSVRHVEKRFRITDEFVHVSFSRYLLHYPFLVVIPQRSAQFVIIHRRSILLNTPSTSHLNGIKERKKEKNIALSLLTFQRIYSSLRSHIYLFRFDELELHPTTGPRDARRVRWIVQQGDQKLPQLQRTSTLLLISNRHLAPR